MDPLQKEARLKELSAKKADLQALRAEIDADQNEMTDKGKWLVLLNADIESLGKKIVEIGGGLSDARYALGREERDASHLCSFSGSSSWTPELKARAEKAQKAVLDLAAKVEDLENMDRDAKSEIEEKRKTAIRFEKRIQALGEKLRGRPEKKEKLSKEILAIEAEINTLSAQSN